MDSNLVPNDTLGKVDVFVYDRQSGVTVTTKRVSVKSDGTEGNDNSYAAAISANGRFVAFESLATNLVEGDTNGARDIFVHDLQTGTTERVSVSSAGDEANSGSISRAPSISADGRFVAFHSDASNLVEGDANGKYDIFVRDRQSGTTEIVSLNGAGLQADGNSYYPVLSADGRYVAFQSAASYLVPGDTNSKSDIFVHDRLTGATERVSVDSQGNQSNGNSIGYSFSLSGDGGFVAFESDATNLIAGDSNNFKDIFLRDRGLAAEPNISVTPTSHDFGSVFVGQWSEARVVSVSNQGTADLVVGAIALSGADPSEFGTRDDMCFGLTLAPGASCTIETAFGPLSGGAKSAQLSIPSGDPDTPEFLVSLSGTGQALAGNIGASPASYDFGSVYTGTVSVTRTFTVTNSGNADLVMGSLTLSGAHPEQFSKLSDNCSA